MKNKLKDRLRRTMDSCRGVVKNYPVEMALALLTMVCGILFYEDIEIRFTDTWLAAAHLFAFSYLLNNIFRKGKARIVYYLSWLPALGLCFVDLDGWFCSTAFWIELLCLMLAIPVAKRRKDNPGFVADNWWLFSGIVASGFMVTVCCLLFCALAVCTIDLFNLSVRGERPLVYIAVFSYTAAFALLLLSYMDKRDGKVPEKTGVLSVLLYYIVTPALVAFNCLFYAYIVKIIVQWSLPSGYVAAMIFIFSLLAFAAKALRELVPKKRYGWYFDNLSVIAVPALVLFWVGVVYRLCQYGFTESRVYLVLCGLIMTLSFALFVCRRRGVYRYCWIFAIAILGTFTFVKLIDAAHIGLWSQERRVVRLAAELGLLEGPRKLKQEVSLPDREPETLRKLEQLRQALRYVYWNSDYNYGVDPVYSYGDNVLDLRDAYGRSGSISFYWDNDGSMLDVESISHVVFPGYLYSGSKWVCGDGDGHLRIYCRPEFDLLEAIEPGHEVTDTPDNYNLVWEKPLAEIAAQLIRKCGITREQMSDPYFPTDEDTRQALTRYEDDELILLFSHVNIYPDEDGRLSSFNVEMILIKK